jgi:outer membrane immunogenic protein
MRRLLLVAVMCGVASVASAADMPDLPFLRGSFTEGLSTSRVNWQGFYVGGQAGYGSSDENFNGSNQAMTATMLANTVIEGQLGVSQWPLNLGKTTGHSTAYGGFTGYNWQFDDVVVGVEASYMHGSLGGTSSASMRRFYTSPLSDGFYHDITSSASSSITISDMATFRARAAYSYGSFLPYAFAGVALGNADISRSVSVIDRYAAYAPPYATACSSAGTPYCFTPSLTNAQHNRLIYGYSFGLGADINLIGGLFMRAEWEYVRFTTSVDTTINTVRAGLGYKF